MTTATVQRLHIVLRLEQYRALVAESERTGARLSELIRRAVEAKYGSGKRNPKPDRAA